MTKLVNLEIGDKVQLTSYGEFWRVLKEPKVNIEDVIQKLERDFFEILTGKRKENTVSTKVEDLGEALKDWTKGVNIDNIGVSQEETDETIDILKNVDKKKTPYEQIALMHNITVEELQDILLSFDNGDGDVLSLMSQRLNYEEGKS